MREIKFRAWDSDCKRIFNLNLFDVMTWERDRPTKHLSSMELMQFTGLKDKNGKDIYEGDIVKRFWKTEHGDEWKSYSDDTKLVEWSSLFDGEYGDTIGYGWELGQDEGEPQFEVIGNVYEHSHLLEKEAA